MRNVHGIDLTRLEQAVKSAEMCTSAELRVHIARTCPGSPLDAATRVFAALGMHKTRLRNGVLVFVAPTIRKGAIIGDVGIAQRVSEDFFAHLFAQAQSIQAEQGWTAAIEMLIQQSGQALAVHFPRHADDLNELSDHVSVE